MTRSSGIRTVGVAAVTLLVGTLLFVPAASAGGGGGCFDPPAKGTGATVRLSKNCFRPALLASVPSGTAVTFINVDQWDHTVTGLGGWGTEFEDLGGGKAIEVRFARDGVYPYTCILHPGMTGAVVVGDAAGPGPTRGAVTETTQLVLEGGDDEAVAAPSQPVPEGGGLPWPGIAAGIGLIVGGLGFGVGRFRRERRAAAGLSLDERSGGVGP